MQDSDEGASEDPEAFGGAVNGGRALESVSSLGAADMALEAWRPSGGHASHAGAAEAEAGTVQLEPAGAHAGPPEARIQAMIRAARFHGIDLDPAMLRRSRDGAIATAETLSRWARDSGLWSRPVKLRFRHLLKLRDKGPIVLLFTDGGAGVFASADRNQRTVLLEDPLAPPAKPAIAVDELRLERFWAGEAVLLRPAGREADAEAPFNLRWLMGLLGRERRLLRDVGVASLTLSALTLFPPLLVMVVADKVITHHSYSTLALLSVILGIGMIYETVLGFSRRLIVLFLSTRTDTTLSLHLFNRLLRLPLDYFERHPAGETMHKIAQSHKIREFLTGKLLSTMLDLLTLAVLLPFLFYLNATLAWIVLGCAVLIGLIIVLFLPPLRASYAKVILGETAKTAILGESIQGIKTLKSLAIEPQRKALWDELVADAAKWRLKFGRLANWPQTMITPIERFMSFGIILVGASLALGDERGGAIGALFAFMMLSMRVAQPLANLARLIDDFEELNAAIAETASVVNQLPEAHGAARGLRPRLDGGIRFEDVTFTYAGATTPALRRVSLAVPAGVMFGVVGRSGSGKSTLARLIQGINREYSGLLKLDGLELRGIDLRYLRSNIGVVLQDSFLFSGTIRDNIIAWRPDLTLRDAVRAARLAGAEEFIERLPCGYETRVEEGSSNLSGGQRQRLAIARALITDPRILILDEATSSLDPDSEALVNTSLQGIANGRTVIIVSHRLSTLTRCSEIAVLENGGLVDIAPHRTLLERCGIYRHLWAQQHRHLNEPGIGHASHHPADVKAA